MARLFEGHGWIDETIGAPPGSLHVWSAAGTLVMASCAASPRLAEWRWTGPATLEWSEDGARIPAEIAVVGPDELVLRVDLAGGAETRGYRRAGPGALC